MQLRRVTSAKLPTSWGSFTIIGFEEKITGKAHLALTLGDISGDIPILTRIHSECLTGDALFSLRCDCGFQLETALKRISKEKRGILIYHRQEGRNIGLLNKIRAYALQDEGLDTVEANHKLGFAADERNFMPCVDILNLLGVKKIKLLTNNPEKIRIMRQAGIDITARVALEVGKNINNINYLSTKARKLGHLFQCSFAQHDNK